MTPQSDTHATGSRHAGPPLGVVAIIFTVLKGASLVPVSIFGAVIGVAPPYFPGPTTPAANIETYFRTHPTPVLICAVLQFGSAIPLGIFTATVVSRLRFLGVRVAGIDIALFGGLAAAFNSVVAASALWVMAHPGIAEDRTLVRALYYMQFALPVHSERPLPGATHEVPAFVWLIAAGFALPKTTARVSAAG